MAKSRGGGKTWIVALCAHAMAVLYPGSRILVVSGTAMQATLILQKLNEMKDNPAILRELDARNGREPIKVTQNKGVASFLNGSKIESFSIRSVRGQRAKVIIIDESPEVNKNDLDAAVGPVMNEKRKICHTLGIKDYTSKRINISSACEKTNHFYEEMLRLVKQMQKGDKEAFAMALDWRSAVRVGMTDAEFFEKERARMPQPVFDMEYGTVFLGEEANSMFTYSMIEQCRVLKDIELSMPKGSESKYVIAIDIASGSAKSADNTVLVVLKLTERQGGNIGIRMVYMRSFKGMVLDELAREIRRLYVRFPNTVKIVFDQRGVGDALPRFLDEPWTDPETGKEYPPLVLDDAPPSSPHALPILRSVKATNAINQALVGDLRVVLEQEKLALPVSSRNIVNGRMVLSAAKQDGDDDEMSNRPLTIQEQAVYIETDALQFELGNIVAKRTSAGNYIYDTARPSQHKDRYSALAMGVSFVAEMEDLEKRRSNRRASDIAIGFATNF